jgi:hypothetical protein
MSTPTILRNPVLETMMRHLEALAIPDAALPVIRPGRRSACVVGAAAPSKGRNIAE